jgi:hypothetical protein
VQHACMLLDERCMGLSLLNNCWLFIQTCGVAGISCKGGRSRALHGLCAGSTGD